ncbi:hypothetical protein DFA_07348 [Cavenderia fasciculata]|uniref:Uncharacterized protein n=1 Tax=Cavenderia fasciculata TaxID=261658 RepID=F4PW63_CACFS|nr:uncharacterized protein DFA_07348 [Cavenderia fasciculata]EGG20227.1 hypothetical protein DFA_07348 [Cavenderia fasciculata]|eukprot:XP_004367210.1 hypothetical protein DFA_07348 [Cavenderia fasciculata]
MSNLFKLARRTLFNNRQQLLRGGDHGHGHGHGPEYGFSPSIQKGLSLTTKIVGCVVFFYVPFLSMSHQKAKREATSD